MKAVVPRGWGGLEDRSRTGGDTIAAKTLARILVEEPRVGLPFRLRGEKITAKLAT